MSVDQIDFIVEEPSMEAFLRVLLPCILRDVAFSIFPFQDKNQLLERLPARLRGYAAWLPETYRIVVVVDRDDDDCHALKRELECFAELAGLPTRSHPAANRFTVVNRIAIEELEAWYFGDWEAVRNAYPRVARDTPRKAPYRDPDGILGGTWEAFERVLQRAGYFRTGLRKIEAAKAIAPHFDPNRNRSRSFQVFRHALHELVTD